MNDKQRVGQFVVMLFYALTTFTKNLTLTYIKGDEGILHIKYKDHTYRIHISLASERKDSTDDTGT